MIRTGRGTSLVSCFSNARVLLESTSSLHMAISITPLFVQLFRLGVLSLRAFMLECVSLRCGFGVDVGLLRAVVGFSDGHVLTMEFL